VNKWLGAVPSLAVAHLSDGSKLTAGEAEIELFLFGLTKNLSAKVFDSVHLHRLAGCTTSPYRMKKMAVEVGIRLSDQHNRRARVFKHVAGSLDDWTDPSGRQWVGCSLAALSPADSGQASHTLASGDIYEQICAGHEPLGTDRGTATNIGKRVARMLRRMGLAEVDQHGCVTKTCIKWWVGNLAVVEKLKGSWGLAGHI
jgi:hypothetical protein